MNQPPGSALLIGYGNPGRLDDGLGPALADQIEQLGIPQLRVETCYQLSVEDAERAAAFDHVLFADAAIQGPEPFDWKPVDGQTTIAFSTHFVSPETIIGLAQSVFRSNVRGYTLAIRGYEFDEFGERLSAGAHENLVAAARFVESLFRGTFDGRVDRLALGRVTDERR